MIPKFRAWDKISKCVKEVTAIDWSLEIVEFLNGAIERSIDDVILMQRTDLYDVNGNQYCQDDLVKWNGIVYRLTLGTYAFELSGFYYQMQDNPYDFFSEGAYLEGEVIGNLYENPELLEGDKA